MSTATIDPPVQAESPPPPRRRHIFRWVVAGMVLPLLFIASFSYVQNYQPLVGSGVMLDAPFPASGLELQGPGAPGFGLGTVHYYEGAPLLWGLNIRNDGPFPVTVTGAEWHGPRAPFGKVTFLLATKAAEQGLAAIGPTTGLAPLQPFTLAHGQQRTIYVRFVTLGCTVPFSSESRFFFVDFGVNSLVVDSRAFGVARVTTLSAGPNGGFQISVPADASCKQSDGSMQPLSGG